MLSKKIISFAASVLIVFSTVCPALAANTSRPSEKSSPIHVDYAYINRASSTLSISNGTAHIWGYVQSWEDNLCGIHSGTLLRRFLE